MLARTQMRPKLYRNTNTTTFSHRNTSIELHDPDTVYVSKHHDLLLSDDLHREMSSN